MPGGYVLGEMEKKMMGNFREGEMLVNICRYIQYILIIKIVYHTKSRWIYSEYQSFISDDIMDGISVRCWEHVHITVTSFNPNLATHSNVEIDGQMSFVSLCKKEYNNR